MGSLTTARLSVSDRPGRPASEPRPFPRPHEPDGFWRRCRVRNQPSELLQRKCLSRWGRAGSFPRRRAVVPRFDGLDGLFERAFQPALADGPEHEADEPSLEVLAVAYHDVVHLGRSVGLSLERVGVARAICPGVGVGGGQYDAVGVGPVVAQSFPDATRALRDIGLAGALGMHLEIAVGTVFKELCAARSEVGEAGDELLGRRSGRLLKVEGGHASSLSRGGQGRGLGFTVAPVKILVRSRIVSYV